MGKRSPAPPPAPDYTTLAIKQGEANLAAAKQSAYMSNPNVYGPTGSQTVSWTKTPTVDTDAYNKAMEQFRAAQLADPLAYVGEAPTQEQFTTYIEQPTITQSLGSDAALQALRSQERAQLSMSQAAESAASGLRDLGIASAFDARSIPGLQYSVPGAGAIATPGSYVPYRGEAGFVDMGFATGDMQLNAPGAGGYAPTTGYYTEQLPGQMGTGQQAFGGPAAPGLGQFQYGGPQTAIGETGFAPAGSSYIGIPREYGVDYSGVGGVGQGTGPFTYGQAFGGPTGGLYGMAGGGPQAAQLQGLNLAGVGGVAGGMTGREFGMAAGGPGGVQFQGLDTSGLMGIQGGVGQFGQAQGGMVAGPQLRGLDLSGIGGPQGAPAQGQFGYAQQFVQGPQLQGQIDIQGLAAAPIQAGTTAQQAIMSRLQPQLQGERQQLYTQLVNQGLAPGGEAFNAAMSAQAQKENDLLLQAAAQGIALDQAARQQGFAEQQSRAMFANQAQLQGFGAGMEQAGLYNVGLGQNVQQSLATQAAANQAQQQAFQQRLAGAQFGQEAELARFGAGMQSEQARNQAIAQNTQLALQSGQFANEAQAQQFSQRLAAGEFGREAQLASFQTGQAAQDAVNRAIAQNFQQAMAGTEADRAAQAQRFGQAVTGGEFAQQQALAQFGMGQQAQEAANQAIAQNFAQGQAAQQMQNQAVQQNLQSALAAEEAQRAAQAQRFGQAQDVTGLQAQLGAQQFGQQAQLQQIINAAGGQNFQQALASREAFNQAQQQAYQQALQGQQFNREALMQQFGMGQQAQELTNAAAAQNFAQQQQAAQFNLARQQQQAAQAAGQAGFYNEAQAQAYQRQLAQQAAQNAAQAQRFGQVMDYQGLRNQALAQNQAQDFQRLAAQNAAQQQQFQQNIAQQQFYNTAVQQALAQQAAIRSLPVNEISALLSGGQVSVPQFQGYSGVTVAPAPIFQGGQAQDAAAMQRYGIQANQAASNMGGLFNLAGSLGSAAMLGGVFPSDRRLKSNIVRIGTHPLGIGVYEYDIFGTRQRGVMADEVEQVRPEAVITRDDGFQMVNYGML
jgi:hypothetical protein